MTERLVLGIDIGGTHLRLGFVDEKREISDFTIIKSQPILDTSTPILKLKDLIENFCAEHNKIPEAVSIGFPSTIDAKREKVISTPNIKSLNNLEVSRNLGELLNIPVFINRDVNMILLSDLDEMKIDTKKLNICAFYIGTGLGNVIMIHDQMLTGRRGFAAELGHMHVPGLKMKCGCGSEGCIELITGGLALARIQREHFPDTYIGDMFTKHRDHKLVQEYIDNLALAVSNEMVLIDPDLTVFGGGVLQMNDFPKEDFEKALYKYQRRPCNEGDFEFVYVKESQHSGVKGGGIYAIKRLEDKDYI